MKFLVFIILVLYMQANSIAVADSYCDKIPHMDRLKFISSYFDNGSEKFVCYETMRVGDSVYMLGDSLCKKIISTIYQERENEIIPCLIEKIKDTTFARAEFEGAYNYTISDIAITLITSILGQRFEFRALEHFYHEHGGFYSQLHHKFFISEINTPEENYKNRITTIPQ